MSPKTLCLVLLLPLARVATAQVAKVKYDPPVTVNFNERVMFELNFRDTAARRLAAPRAIEQGEDRENFKIRPKPVKNIRKIENISPATRLPSAPALESASPAPSLNIKGVMDSGQMIPPDINGAAGTNFIMETTNQFFSVYKKNGNRVSTIQISSLFNPAGGRDYFDPHIVFDPGSRHFIIAIDGELLNGDQGFFLAITKTDDPTGDWLVYGIDGLGNNTDFLDYDQLGFNSKWIVLTGNDFLANQTNQAKLFVFDKKSLYGGSAGVVTRFTDTTADLISPASTYDTTQQTEYLVSDWNGSFEGNGFVRVSTITGSTAQPVYNQGFTLGVSQPWSQTTVNAPQLGNTNLLETGDTRISSCIYRNSSLWFTHHVYLPADNPTYSAVDWWQVDPSIPNVTQFGRIADPNGKIFHFYPSLDVNTCNDMLIGFSISGSNTYAGAEYALRQAGDPNGAVESPVQFIKGLAGYFKTYGKNRNRWGDYTGTSFDPVDNSFWTFQEWANSNNNWGTQIANIKLPACYLDNPTGVVYDGKTQKLSWTAVPEATLYTIKIRDMTSGSTHALTKGKGYNSVTSRINSLMLAPLNLIKKHQYQFIVSASNTCCNSGPAEQPSEIKLTY